MPRNATLAAVHHTAPPQELQAASLPIWRETLAGFDWAALHLSPTYLGFGVARGHGEPVVVVPGFTASDASLIEMHAWLGRVGYAPYFSGIGRNTRCPEVHIKKLLRTVDRAYRETGTRVTVIGHSLGGCFARAAAMHRPATVAQVITLGSPVQGASVHPLVRAASEATRGDCTSDCYTYLQDDLPRGIAEANIYTKTDGIVDWHTAARDDCRDTIEVRGTHVGLVWNAQVYRAIGRLVAERIAVTPRELPRRIRRDARHTDHGRPPAIRRAA